MENNVQNDNQYDDEIDLKELFDALWAGRKKIIFITALFALISVIYAFSLPDQYKATTLLAPAKSSDGSLSSALGQLSDLASFAGVNVGGGESSEAQIAQEIMKSWSFIESFIADNNLAPEVIATKGWDKGSNELHINDGIYDSENKKWLVENEAGIYGPPSSWNLFEAFSELLEVSEDTVSGLVTVSIEHYSPQISKKWLDMYVAAINSHMQQRQVTKASSNINYLQAQIEKTSIAEMREVFYSIIEEQTKNKMLAEASPEYVFVAVSPSMLPEQKSQPQRALIFFVATLLGGMFSILLVLIMHYFRKTD